MTHPLIITLAVAALTTTAACDNAARAVDHSVAASAYGSAAVGESVATAVAVPIIVTGGALALSGAGIQGIGVGSMQIGASVFQDPPAPMTITPNGAPTLN